MRKRAAPSASKVDAMKTPTKSTFILDTTTNASSSSREVEELIHEAAAQSSPSNRNTDYTTPSKTCSSRASFYQLQEGLSTSKRSTSSPLSPASNTVASLTTRNIRSRRNPPGGSSNNYSTLLQDQNNPSIRPLQDFTLWYHIRLIGRQSQKLFALLVHGTPIWMLKMARLLMFVVALIPAFCVTVWFYFVSSDRVAVPYIVTNDNNKKTTDQRDEDGGEAEKKTRIRTSRHFLDIYGSTTTLSSDLNNKSTTTTTSGATTNTAKPVCIFLTGGAWIIGYKAWGTLLARVLVNFGILVVIPDYRNFPQTNLAGMVDDVDAAMAWTLANIADYGGDPTKIVLAGQSAGAHLGACLLLQKAQLEVPTKTIPYHNNTTSWRARDIKGFIATSGPYNLVAMQDILHQHGLDKSIVAAMFCHDVARYSPSLTLQHLAKEQQQQENVLAQRVREQFPPTCVIHGEVDKTVPYAISVEFYEALNQLYQSQSSQSPQRQHPYLEFKLYPSWSHTDPILEAPFAGNHLFHRDVYDLIKLWTSDSTSTDDEKHNEKRYIDGDVNTDDNILLPFDESHSACQKICPVWLVQIARFCNPF